MADRTLTVRLRAITSDFTRGLNHAANETMRFGRANEKALNQVGKMGMLAGGAMVGMALVTGKAAMDFESSFAGVRKTVDATEAEFSALSTSFREMATEIPVTVNEINRIGEAAGQLGIEMGNIEGFTRTMADLGVATNMASDEAATSLARLANITQMPQTEFDRLGSTVVDLGNNLATTESEIVEMGLRLAGAGSQIGMTEAEILSLGGALSSLGINAEAGGSALSRVMIEIASQVETGGDLLGKFAEVSGMSAQDFATAWREDATGALVEFITGLGRVSEQGGSTLQTLEDLEITEIRMRDALLRASGAGDLLADAIGRGNTAWEENTALTAEAAQRYETAESRIQMAKNQLNDLAIDVGAGVLPKLVSLAETGASIAERFGELPGPAKEAAGVFSLVGGTILFVGGASLYTIPKVAALNATLATTGGIAGTAGMAMKGTARFLMGPWSLAVGGATLVLSSLAEHEREAATAAEGLREQLDGVAVSAEDLSDEWIIAELRQRGALTAASDLGISLTELRGAISGDRDALDDLVNKVDDTDAAFFHLVERLPLVSTEKGRLLRAVYGLANGYADYNDEVHANARALITATTPLQSLTDGTMGWIERMRESTGVTAEMRQAAADAGVDISSLTEETEEATSVFDGFAPSILAAADALNAGFDPMRRYQSNLADLNEASRAAAEGTAEAHNESIDRQIRALRERTDAEAEAYRNEIVTAEDGSRVKRSFYQEQTDAAITQMQRERDARIEQLEDQKAASSDYYAEELVNYAAYRAAQEQTLADQREWHANLNAIRDIAGDDYADLLAAQGPEFASLHAEIAKQEHDEIRASAATAQTIRDEAATEAVARLIRAGTEFVTATGDYNYEAVVETAEKLGTTPGVVEGILNRSNAIADQRLQAMIKIFRAAGEGASRDMRVKLGEAIPEVARIAKQYGIDVGGAIAPLLSAIGDDRSAQAVARYIRGEQITGLNTGGPVPGSGPDRDSVLAYLTPEEYVTRRSIVREQGPDKFDMLNAGLADIVPRYNAGGRVTGDIEGLNLEFLGRIRRWAGALGDTYHVTSGYRSIEEQARLYALYKSGQGNLAAPPGRSKHNFGLATDGPRWGHRGPGAHAMHYNVSGEPWHLEPVDAAALMGGATAGGGAVPGLAIQIPKPPTFPHRGIAETADNVAAYLHATAQAFADANTLAPAMQTATGQPASGSLQEMAREMLNGRGWGGQWGAFDTLVRKESSWNPTAQNPTSTAFGLGQFLNSTWATVGGSKTSDPGLQLEYMMRYIAQRYGTPEAALRFHLANNWYNQGGVVGMARGGIINERIDGIGASGQRYAFGENGPERVTPMNAGGLIRAEDGSLVPPSFYAGRPTAATPAAPPPPPRPSPPPSPYGTMPAAPTFAGSSLRLNPDEYRRRVEVNNRLFELGITTLSDHLSNLERRMLRTVPFSEEWMALFGQRKRLVDDLLDEHLQAVEDAQRRQDDALDNLNGLLDERNRITERMADEEERARRARNAALDRHNEARLRIEQRFNDERERILASRAGALFDAMPIEQRAAAQWANSISAVLRNEMERATQREDWAQGLDLLRGMGLSEDAIAAFGLGDLTEESLAKVKLWSQSTETEIAALNAAIAERQRFASDQAETEAQRQLGAVGEELAGLTEQTAEEMESVRVELAETLAGIDADLTENMEQLHADMAAIGLDTGRSWAEAMAEGINSGIPGILAAVEAANAAKMQLHNAQASLGQAEDIAASNPPAGSSASVAPLGHHYVLPDGRHMLRLSDQTWYQATGPGQISELHRLYGPPSDHPGIKSDRILGSLVSLFGAGGMEAFTSAQIQPKYFHGGGMFTRDSTGMGSFQDGEIVAPQPMMREIVRDEAGSRQVVAAIEGLSRRMDGTTLRAGDRLALHVDGKDIEAVVTSRQADRGEDFRTRARRGRQTVR